MYIFQFSILQFIYCLEKMNLLRRKFLSPIMESSLNFRGSGSIASLGKGASVRQPCALLQHQIVLVSQQCILLSLKITNQRLLAFIVPQIQIMRKYAKWILGGSALVMATQYGSEHHKAWNLLRAGISMTVTYKFSTNDQSTKHTTASRSLRDALKANGGIYLKLGQLIASLDVIVPDEYRNTMRSLTRECSREDFQEVKKTLEEDLNYPVKLVFRSISELPISSASIAQVHRAVLLSGKEVAVKVQHRGLREAVEKDLVLLRKIMELGKKLFPEFDYEWLIDGFDKNIRKELDFVKQAENMERVRRYLQKHKEYRNVHVPEVLYRPTQRVLVMQFIHGAHIDELEALQGMKVDLKKIGKTFSNLIVKMIHSQGFVHADTHSGNLMVRKLKNKDQLVLLDHGLYQQLDSMMIEQYNRFWLGLILNDDKIYAPAARLMGTSNPNLLRSMLLSKPFDELNDPKRSLFDLNPSADKDSIVEHATKEHKEIVRVLGELRREMLLLMKVNEYARSLQTLLGGRPQGVYYDVARECVRNVDASYFQKLKWYLKMWWNK